MASNTFCCGFCGLTNESVVCCIKCKKGLCLECQKRHLSSKRTRNHKTVPFDVSLLCREHQELYQNYCKDHDRPCCSRCVFSYHSKCQELNQLDDMIRNFKKSYSFHDIEQALIDMLENIQKIKIDRQANLSTLQEERKIIEKEIQQTRIKINSQLDKLQESILNELYEAESKESKIIRTLLKSIEENEKEIKIYNENLINIKRHASDLQTFLVMKQMERDVAQKDEYFTSLVESNKLNRVSLSCKINDVFNETRQIGKVLICVHSSEVVIIRKKENQAQIAVVHARSKSLHDLSFILQATIDTQLYEIRGCTLLPENRMVFSCYKQNRVKAFNRDGSLYFDISLHPTWTLDITFIHDNNAIAVTSGGGGGKYFSIIDVASKKVKETIAVNTYNDGIVSRKNALIYSATGRGLQMMNLSDKSVRSIVTSEIPLFTYVATFDNKLYYTNMNTQTVICCDLHGTIQWEFKDASVLRCPLGICVDNSGNVYVVGEESQNVVGISPDGKQHRQILSCTDGLINPTVIHYDANQLLVANRKEKAFLIRLE